jgi:DNA-binding response OmpR family regulator
MADALDVASRKRFDLYLVDIRLPDGDGFEFCRRVREFDPDTPVLFYTAAADSMSRAEATRVGAQGYLAKPVSPEALEEAITEILSSGGPDSTSP